jgi:hypothetical protein
MAVPAEHISENELIDLANDALDENRLDAVLGHIAECDDCATLSSRIHKTAMFWDDWRERLAAVVACAPVRSAGATRGGTEGTRGCGDGDRSGGGRTGTDSR